MAIDSAYYLLVFEFIIMFFLPNIIDDVQFFSLFVYKCQNFVISSKLSVKYTDGQILI